MGAMKMHIGRLLGGFLLVAWATGLVLAAPLVDAVRDGDQHDVLGLLEVENVNKPSSNGTTALHWAVHNDNPAMVAALLGAGAEVNVVNDYGATPMGEVALTGNAAILEMLLDAGADVESANAEGQTALMVAARSGHLEAAELLIEHGADVNATESWKGQSALIWAAAQSQPEMVKLLIEHGADVNARSTVNDWPRQITAEPRFMWRPLGGYTALIYAAREGCLQCVQHLVEAGADIDQPSAESRTPLLIAIINLHFDEAAYLIESGANVNKWDNWGEQPLYAAVDMHILPVGGHPDRPSLDDITALDVIDMLLERGANPNAQLKLMLHHRSIKDDRGADPILTIGATPLLRAAKAFDVPVVERLLAHGALPDLPNEQGITPLMSAAGLGITTVDTRGHYDVPDVEQKALDTIDLLLAAGADINKRSRQGFSPLHGAAWWGWNEVVKHLVDQGANLLAESNDGYTAIDVADGKVTMGFGRGAATASHPDTVALLETLIGEVDDRLAVK